MYVTQIFFVLILSVAFFKKRVTLIEILITILSIFLITFVVNIFSFISLINFNNIIMKVAFYLLGYSIFVIGVTLIIRSNFIISCFDKFIVVSSIYFKKNPGIIKVYCDITFLVISIIMINLLNLETRITIATFLTTFVTGYIIKILLKYIK